MFSNSRKLREFSAVTPRFPSTVQKHAGLYELDILIACECDLFLSLSVSL